MTGEVVESYSMVTTNADDQRRLHRPDPSRPFDKQEKRAVVPIEIADLPSWLGGLVEEASRLVRLPDSSVFVSGPASPEAPAQRLGKASLPSLL